MTKNWRNLQEEFIKEQDKFPILEELSGGLATIRRTTTLSPHLTGAPMVAASGPVGRSREGSPEG